VTHDKLLAKIDYAIEGNPYDEYIEALRAVVELHYEHKSGSGDVYCYNCQQKYPCLTIQAIEKELQ
jgi:hypothetical protein